MTDVVKTSIALCSADQKRFLLAEIKGLSYYRLPQKKPAPEPLKVKEARKIAEKHQRIVDNHKKLIKKKEQERLERYNALVQKAKDSVYFGTPGEARAAVKKLREFS